MTKSNLNNSSKKLTLLKWFTSRIIIVNFNNIGPVIGILLAHNILGYSNCSWNVMLITILSLFDILSEISPNLRLSFYNFFFEFSIRDLSSSANY